MNYKTRKFIVEMQMQAEKDLEEYKKLGCNSYACGVEIGVIETCRIILKDN